MYEKVFFFITQITLQQMLHAVQGVIIHLLLSIMLVVSTFHIYVLGFKYLLSASLFVCKYVCDALQMIRNKTFYSSELNFLLIIALIFVTYLCCTPFMYDYVLSVF